MSLEYSSKLRSISIQLHGGMDIGNWKRKRVSKQQKEDSISHAKKIYAKKKEENLKAYSEVYKEFFNRGGADWYLQYTGKAIDIEKIYFNIDYFVSCLKEGIDKEDRANGYDKAQTELVRRRAEKELESKQRTRKEYNLHNPAWAPRMRRMIKATPKWVSKEEIKKIFKERDRIIEETGVPHEVDHIVPIMGRKVCGLHVHHNLQVITQSENRHKSNKYGQ